MSPTNKVATSTERRVSPRKKVASPDKRGKRPVSFNWDNKLTMVLLEICGEFQSTHGKKQKYKWPQILEKFHERTQIHVEVGVLRNRLEVLRRHYQIWRRLKGSETGLGIDPVTGKIDADPKWWELKIKENPDFKRFRDNGVPPDMEALWDEVFGDTYATGEYCAVPGMDAPPDSPTSNVPDIDRRSTSADPYTTMGENDPELEDLEGIDPSIFRNIDKNKDDKGNLSPASGLHSPPSLAAPRRMSNTSSGGPISSPSGMNLGANKRPKLSRAASAFQDVVSELRAEGRRTYDLIENIVTSPSAERSTLDQNQQIKDAYDVLYEMVEDGLIEGGTDLFCFAASKILDENGRKGFMFRKSNAHRLAWLEYQIKKE